jgi:hypothetical protein
MGNVGLLYVGAILFINGCALLGWVRGNGAVPLNIFVGLLQVLTPTYLIFTANGDPDVIFGASGLYLFGFTYLYVALNTIWGFDGTGLGYFSLFVAIAAVGVRRGQRRAVPGLRLRRHLAALGLPVVAVLPAARTGPRTA